MGLELGRWNKGIEADEQRMVNSQTALTADRVASIPKNASATSAIQAGPRERCCLHRIVQ